MFGLYILLFFVIYVSNLGPYILFQLLPYEIHLSYKNKAFLAHIEGQNSYLPITQFSNVLIYVQINYIICDSLYIANKTLFII